MSFLRLTTAGVLLFALSYSTKADAPKVRWKLTWSDEFNGPDGSPLDSKKWSYDLGKGPGPGELESFTRRPQNVRIEQGHLVIEARKENYIGADGFMADYTSGRIKTQNLFAQKYGRFEARMKVPNGKGISPAFWMEGEDKPSVSWPACGEIDIMENLGRTPDRFFSTLHGPGFLSDSKLTDSFSLGQGKRLTDDYHVYAVDWSRTEVVFTLDGIPYSRMVRDTPEHGRDLPLDQPFFIILSMAIMGDSKGGPATLPGQLPAQLDVDYVRVYQRE